MNTGSERGMALVIAMMAVALMAALGASLAVLTNTEVKITGNYVEAVELRSAAEAAMAAVIQEVAANADWAVIVAGPALSALADGSPGGSRMLSDGSSVDLDDLTVQAAAGDPTCRLFAYGPVQGLLPGEDIGIDGYFVVWVADDRETDPDVLILRAQAFGASGMRRMLEARLVRTGAGVVQVASWHEVRP